MATFPSCQLFWQRLRGDSRSSHCHSWIHWRLVVKPFISKYEFWTFLFVFSYCDTQTFACSPSPCGKRERQPQIVEPAQQSGRVPLAEAFFPCYHPKSDACRTEAFFLLFPIFIYFGKFFYHHFCGVLFMVDLSFHLPLLWIFQERIENSICKNKSIFRGSPLFHFWKYHFKYFSIWRICHLHQWLVTLWGRGNLMQCF